MYRQHFGLKESPFRLTPDTAFYYAYPDHQEALNVLNVALRMGEGFLKVTGEVGTGKTLLCRRLLNSLDDGFSTAYIPNPCLTPASLRHALAEELGVKSYRNMSQEQVVGLINERLIEQVQAGQKVVVVLDEAQAMPDKTLEALRLLTNLETEKSKLLHVVLFGQPELDARLAQPHLRQLRQRITFSYHLHPMSEEGVVGYIDHRLRVSGYNGPTPFTRRAVKKLYRTSRGIPRLVNVLAHKSLLSAFGQGKRIVEPRHVAMAVADTEDANAGPFTGWRLWFGLAGTLTSIFSISAALLLRG